MTRYVLTCAAMIGTLSSPMAGWAATLVIENGVPGYTSLVRDAALRSEGEISSGVPWGEGNIGNSTTIQSHRMYPDVGFPNTRGPRRYIVWFDVSGIPAGSVINSATLSLFFQRSGSDSPAINNYRLSRLRPGKDWIEGAGQAPATDGSVTWNCQVSYPSGNLSRIPWATPGATGATDIDLDTTVLFNKAGGGVSEWKDLDVKAFVQGWASGTWANTGILLWGGEGPGGGLQAYWMIVGKETTDAGASSTNRPRLVVNYTPPDNSCGSTVKPETTQTITGFAGGGPVPVARIDLGSPDVPNGITHPICCDGMTVPATIAARGCRRNVNPDTDHFMYFAVDDAVIYNGNHPAVTISFDYFDVGGGQLGVHYDGSASEWTAAAMAVTLTDTGAWKRGSIAITDALFANREHSGSDFRIWRDMSVPFYIDNVTVARSDFDITYTVENTGGASIHWTAAEASADATPADHAWLTLSSTSGTLAGGEAAPVRAMVNTTALLPGAYSGFIRFDDGCPVLPVLTEAFSYAPGPLLGHDGWAAAPGTVAADATDGTILVTADGAIQLFGKATAEAGVMRTAPCDFGVTSVRIKARKGLGTGHYLGNLQVMSGGSIIGWWALWADKVAARDPIHNVVTEQALGDSYAELEMRINPATRQTQYLFNGAGIVTYPFGGTVPETVASVRLLRVANPSVSYPDEYLLLDDLDVSYEGQPTKLRRIDLDVVGCRFEVTPRVIGVQACGVGKIERAFTITNTGAYTIDSLTAAEVEPVNGLPHEYPWLTLSDTSGIAIAPGESALITAAIDMTLVPPPGESASLQVTSNCGATSIRDTLVNALPITVFSLDQPQLLHYPADAEPLDSGFALLEGVEQPGTGGIPISTGVVHDVSNPPDAATDAADGWAYFLQDTGSAKTKYRSLNEITIDPSRGATIVGRLKTTADDGGGNPNNHYGNLFIWAPGLSCEVHWGGPNGLVREANTATNTWLPGDAAYHVLRLTVKNEGGTTGKVVRIYFDENPLAVMTITNANLPSAPGGVTAFGWGVGGTANAQEIYFDWVAATDAGAFAPGEEASCLGCILGNCKVDCRPQYCLEPDGRVFADADGDGDVDMADFAVLQTCFTQLGLATPGAPAWCACLDHGDNNLDGEPECSGMIDNYDLQAFLKCATGANVPWTQAAFPDCMP